MSKLKVWSGNIILLLASISIGILISEIGLRITGIPKSQSSESSLAIYTLTDQYRGGALKSNSSGWWRAEGEAYIQINSNGLRDREHAKQKPENTIRIAVLGDSYAEALQVPIKQTFWSVMERGLSKCQALHGKQVEVINFGVSGYGTAQELMTLRHFVWQYDPDIIVLAFLTGNDIRNNSRALETDYFRPFFIYQGNKLVPDMSFRQLSTLQERSPYAVSNIDQLPAWLTSKSRILQLLREAELEFKKQQVLKHYQEVDTVKIYQEPADSVWQEAWRVTEGLISLMKTEVAAKGANFLVVTLSNPKQVHPDTLVRQKHMQQNNISDLFYPDKRIKALGDRENFPVLNLAPPLQKYADTKKVCLHGFENAKPCDGHWNAEGHRLAGQLISQKLCENLLASKRLVSFDF